MCLLQRFIANPIVIQTVLMVVLVIITAVYTWGTLSIAKVTKKNTIASTRPLLIFKDRITHRDTSVTHNFALFNVGLGPALDVKFALEPKPGHKEEVLLKGNDYLEEHIEKAMKKNKGYALGIAPDNFEDILTGTTVKIISMHYTLEYNDFHGNIYQTRYKDGKTVTNQVSSRSLSSSVGETV